MQRVIEEHQRASRYLASGVSASTRVNTAIGHAMLFDRAQGCRVWDLDGREYIDLCCSHGAALLGHGDPRVRGRGGTHHGARIRVLLRIGAPRRARRVCCAKTIPALERVRLTGSGTEATLHCIRLARAYTGRSKLLLFDGNFHGYHDQVMFRTVAIEGVKTGEQLEATSSGVPSTFGGQLVTSPYNKRGVPGRSFSSDTADENRGGDL